MRRDPALAAALAGVAFVLYVAVALAEGPRLTVECGSYSAFAAAVAQFKAAGAPLPGVLAYIRKLHPPGVLRLAMERLATRVYAEGHPPERTGWEAYRRCQATLGEIEMES
jgi:hypothetical protein